MRRRGEILDTAKIRTFYKHKLGKNVGTALTDEEKAKPFDRTKKRGLPGQAFMGRDLAEHQRWKILGQEWENCLIWVCATEPGRTQPCLYSSIGKMSSQRTGAQGFKHSSFMAGGNVICAGEWIVSKGKLQKISANSGHYRPTIDHLHRAVLFMNEAWNQDTVILLWNIAKDAWEEVPVLVFRDNPSRNGTYRAHPVG
jgi:hypothetical protein